MRPRLVLPALALALSGCSSSRAASPAVPPAVPPAAVPLTSASAAPGLLSSAQLRGLLLQAADLPDLPERREFAGVELSTQAPPQLALCEPAPPTAPHQLANVLAKGGEVGKVQVFEVLSTYADATGADAAYDRALAGARACPSYVSQGRQFTVADLADVDVPGARAAHYRLTTPDVVGGDVRSLAVRGRHVVLVTGYGEPPGGQTVLDYQADVLRRAVARLG